MKDMKFETGERVTLRYQLTEGGAAKDITGMLFRFAAKARHTDDTYKIGPANGVIDDAGEGKFSFTLTMPAVPFSGVYSVVMEDGAGNRTVLNQRGGDAIRVIESLVD